MAGERALPGLGLRAYWTPGSNDWETEHDPDTRLLSILVQAAVISRTTNLPGSPANGAIYIVPVGQANENQIAARDNGAWVYVAPKEGHLIHVNDTDEFVKWTGSAWEVLSSGGGGSADYPDFAGQAGKYLAVNATEDNVEWVEPVVGDLRSIISTYHAMAGNSTSGSTSAFALKGNAFTANEDMKIAAVSQYIDPAAAGEVYQIRLYRLVGTTNQIDALLATSASYNTVNGNPVTVNFAFDNAIQLVAGTSYALVVAIVNGTSATPCRAASEASTPSPMWPNTTFLRSVWHDDSINPASGATLETASDRHIAMGIYVTLAEFDLLPAYAGNAGKVLAVNATANGVEWVDQKLAALNDRTASYVLHLSDAGKYVRMNVAMANTVTVPAAATANFPVGTQIPVRQVGVGKTTIVAAAGVTINTAETLILRKRHSMVTLVKVSTDEWDLTGDVEFA